MNRNDNNGQQLLLDIEELRTRLDVTQRRLQEADERMQAELAKHHQTQRVLEERLTFEMLAELSAQFVNLPVDRIDREIKDAQRRICKLLDIDRSTLWQVHEPGRLLLTHIHQPPGSLTPAGLMNAADLFPWLTQKILCGDAVTLSKLTDLPPEASRDGESARAYGTKAGVYLPLAVGEGPVFGMLAFAVMREERNWPEMVVTGFKLIAQVFANALARKRAEQKAFESRRELLRLERRLRMGELSASLSHELNQPLTAIQSNASAALRFLKSGNYEASDLEDILQDIVADNKRAGDIIRGLRAMVKPDEGEKERVSITETVQGAVNLFHSEAIIRNVHVQTDLVEPAPLVNMNKVQIQQVLINLMMNAADAMLKEPRKKVITLQTSTPRPEVVQVAVRDTGSGVAEEDMEKIFGAFFTTKRSGLGMGLSLSRSILESHGGHIWAQNNPDRGAIFYFDLPVTVHS